MTKDNLPVANARPLVLISSCLLGNKVRYDGKDKRNADLYRYLLPFITPLAVCPEAMAGLEIPRPPVHLVSSPEGLRAIGRDDPALDVTARLLQMARIQDAAHPLLAGALLQSRSPSCGVASTPRVDRFGQPDGSVGAGLFAGELLRLRPGLPTLEDTAFGDVEQVQAFLAAARAYVGRLARHRFGS